MNLISLHPLYLKHALEPAFGGGVWLARMSTGDAERALESVEQLDPRTRSECHFTLSEVFSSVFGMR